MGLWEACQRANAEAKIRKLLCTWYGSVLRSKYSRKPVANSQNRKLWDSLMVLRHQYVLLLALVQAQNEPTATHTPTQTLTLTIFFLLRWLNLKNEDIFRKCGSLLETSATTTLESSNTGDRDVRTLRVVIIITKYSGGSYASRTAPCASAGCHE